MSEGHKPGYTSRAKVVSVRNSIVSFFVPDEDAIEYYEENISVDGILSFTYPGTGGQTPGSGAESAEPEPST
jgi:hypothetical protein